MKSIIEIGLASGLRKILPPMTDLFKYFTRKWSEDNHDRVVELSLQTCHTQSAFFSGFFGKLNVEKYSTFMGNQRYSSSGEYKNLEFP